VSLYYVTVITEKFSLCFLWFEELVIQLSLTFSKKLLEIFLMIFYQPTSILLRVLRFLSLFSALVTDGSRLRDENFTFEYNKKKSQTER
jgi:hypothetical protein